MLTEVIVWGGTTLGDSRARTEDVLGALRLGGSRVGQDVELLRASSTAPVNRQLNKIQISFTVTRKHKDVFFAKNFLVAHSKALMAETGTTVTMQFGQFPLWTLNSAFCDSDDGKINGLETVHQYTITGGYFS